MADQQNEIPNKGQHSQDWADWMDCMKMCSLENGEMDLCGWLADQAGLSGVLKKLNCLNLCMLWVNETAAKTTGQAVCSETEGQSE